MDDDQVNKHSFVRSVEVWHDTDPRRRRRRLQPPDGRAGTAKAVRELHEAATTHDLRRTFATMLAAMGIALDLVAAIVGHESGGRDTRTLVRHYVRTDMLERKAHALKGWDERLKGIVSGEERAKVVRLPKGPVAWGYGPTR
jgi:integrase